VRILASISRSGWQLETVKQKPNSYLNGKNPSLQPLSQPIANTPAPPPDWDQVRHLKARAESALLPYKGRYQSLDRKWRRKLKPLCGNLVTIDWERFRPLRQSREEDWSDWLAWLLETSTTGQLGETLFGNLLSCDATSFKSNEKRVCREVPTGNRERRGDIVARWNRFLITHIEVKVGDQDFEKTFDTCRRLRVSAPKEATWLNAILIPEASRTAWRDVAAKHPTEDMAEISWTDVVHALRKSLWASREPTFWRAWAWTFCSAIETRILQLQNPDLKKPGLAQLATSARWVDILATDKSQTKIKTRPEMKAFLKDGVRLYAKALDTMNMFEAETKKLLREAIEARSNWDPLKAHRLIDELDSGGGEGQCWIYATIEGRSHLGPATQLECGLWWNAPGTTKPIVYSGLWNGKKRIRFDWPAEKDGVHSLEIWGSTYLHLALPDSLDIRTPLNRLLNVTLKQLRKVPKSNHS
jgi:hypothetical protein